MQTRQRQSLPAAGRRNRRFRAVSAVMTLMLTAGLAGCGAPALPALDARVSDAETPSPCETAYDTAASRTGTMHADLPLLQRIAASRSADAAWHAVTAACSERAEEGTVRAAQTGNEAATLASRAHAAAQSPATVDFADVVRLSLPDAAVEQLALAEDRAGFALQVLAARGVQGATLAISDNHRTVAERLLSLTGSQEDPRHKVYATDLLLAHPNTVVDPATGLAAPTVAVVEMDCARAWLEALRNADGVTDATLRVVTQAATARLWRAFALGYPAADWALFTTDAAADAR